MNCFTYDEWMNHDFENLLLILNMVYMFALNDVLLLHCLNGNHFILIFLQPCELYVTEGAYTYHK